MTSVNLAFEFYNEQPETSVRNEPTKRPIRKSERTATSADHKKIKALQVSIRTLKEDKQTLAKRADAANNENTRLKSTMNALALQNSLLRFELNSREHAGKAIPEEMLPRLIRLCHPDKHGNSEASNRATTWLLAQRPK